MHFLIITSFSLLLFSSALLPGSLGQDDTPPALQTCSRDQQFSRAHLLEGVKLEILQRLGLSQEPANPTRNAADPGFLEEFATVQRSWELDPSLSQRPPCSSLDFLSEEKLQFRPTSVEKKKRLSKIADNDECPNDLSVDFYDSFAVKFSINMTGRRFITDAKLSLIMSRTNVSSEILQDRPSRFDDRMDIKLITRPDNYFGADYKRFITFMTLPANSIDGRLTINVTKAIGWVLELTSGNNIEIKFEMHIRCSQTLPEGTTFIPNFQLFSGSNSRAALLTISTLQSTPSFTNVRRRKRGFDINSQLTFCTSNQLECCLNRLEINFERDFNWTWVIKPKQIAFNYCSGECPLRWGTETRHSQFLELYRSMVKKNPAAAAEPCCVPNRYLSVNLAVFLEGEHSMNLLEDIIATSCACR